MARIPKRAADRLRKQAGRFQKVLEDARNRDVNESDTVTIVTDLLSEVFGFDKYSEVTSEQCIRGTYCDLAVRVDGTLDFLIEVKAVGLSLKENHLRQAVNYGANHGIPWIVLTNGIRWEVYKIRFERPIGHDLVCAFDFLDVNPRKQDDLDRLFLMCKEGLGKKAMAEYHERTQVVNRFTIAAAIQSEPILNGIRRELRRISDDVKVSTEEISDLLSDVLKRDVLEGEAAEKATRVVSRASNKALRQPRQRRSKQAKRDDNGTAA